MWGLEFFQPALAWLEEDHGFRAPYMPARVREMKAEVKDIMENWENYNFSRLYHPKFKEQAGWIGEERLKEMIQAFGEEVLTWIEHYFGAWLLPPLSLGELLVPGAWQAYRTAAQLVRKHGEEAPTGVPNEVWNAIRSLARRDKGIDLHAYYVQCGDGRRVDLRTYLGAVFWVICVTNVDSEAAFSIVGHMLKRAPASGLAALSAHLANTKNPPTVTASTFEDLLQDPKFKETKKKSQRKVKARTAEEADTAGHKAARELTEKTQGGKLQLTAVEKAKLGAAITKGNDENKKRDAKAAGLIDATVVVEEIDADNMLQDYGHEEDEVIDGGEGAEGAEGVRVTECAEGAEGEEAAVLLEGDESAARMAEHLQEETSAGVIKYTCIACKKHRGTVEDADAWYCQACYDDLLLEPTDIGCTADEAIEHIETHIMEKTLTTPAGTYAIPYSPCMPPCTTPCTTTPYTALAFCSTLAFTTLHHTHSLTLSCASYCTLYCTRLGTALVTCTAPVTFIALHCTYHLRHTRSASQPGIRSAACPALHWPCTTLHHMLTCWHLSQKSQSTIVLKTNLTHRDSPCRPGNNTRSQSRSLTWRSTRSYTHTLARGRRAAHKGRTPTVLHFSWARS